MGLRELQQLRKAAYVTPGPQAEKIKPRTDDKPDPGDEAKKIGGKVPPAGGKAPKVGEKISLPKKQAVKPGRKVPLKKNQKPIKKKSAAAAAGDRELAKLKKQILAKHPLCAIRSPVCTKVAVTLNHQRGRVGKMLLNKKYLEPSCAECNGYIEDHHAWAEERGHKQQRHGK